MMAKGGRCLWDNCNKKKMFKMAAVGCKERKEGRKMSEMTAEQLLMSWDKRSFSQTCKIEKNYNTRQFSFLWIQELFLFSSLAADKHLLTLLLELPASFCVCLGRNFQKPSLLETRLFYKNEYMDIKKKNKAKKLCVHVCLSSCKERWKRDKQNEPFKEARDKNGDIVTCVLCVELVSAANAGHSYWPGCSLLTYYTACSPFYFLNTHFF